MVIVENIEDDVARRQFLLLAPHSQVGLVDRVAADAEVAHRLPQVRGQHLLPGFAVAHLLATGKAVAERIDAARAVGIGRHVTGARRIVTVLAHRAVDAFFEPTIDVQVAQLRIVLGKRKCLAGQPTVEILAGVEQLLHQLALVGSETLGIDLRRRARRLGGAKWIGQQQAGDTAG